jgi:hypothetical protein
MVEARLPFLRLVGSGLIDQPVAKWMWKDASSRPGLLSHQLGCPGPDVNPSQAFIRARCRQRPAGNQLWRALCPEKQDVVSVVSPVRRFAGDGYACPNSLQDTTQLRLNHNIRMLRHPIGPARAIVASYACRGELMIRGHRRCPRR